MKEAIFYGSYLVFPVIAYIIWTKRFFISLKIFTGLVCLVFIYARFIEPQYIRVQHTTIPLWFESNIALIADLHIGKYKKASYVQKLVNTLNTLDVDMILIAGDLTYYPDEWDLKELFAPLKELQHPTYWVLWNHDVEQPWPPLRTELIEALYYPQIHHINNQAVELGGFTLVWLWSHWNREDDTSLLDEYSLKDNIIVLAHNPDTMSKYNNSIADITLVWHTHGGQIRIPWLYKYVIPTRWDFDRWLTHEAQGTLYITAGVGETGLPMRLFNPPTIDVLDIK